MKSQPDPAKPDPPEKDGNLLRPVKHQSFAQADEPSTESQSSTEATTPTTPTPADPPDAYGERLKQTQDRQQQIFDQGNDVQQQRLSPGKDQPRSPYISP